MTRSCLGMVYVEMEHGNQARSTQLVIPRVHDCISLLLGDPRRYQEQFENNPGTYWYSQDFLEPADSEGKFYVHGSNFRRRIIQAI